MPVNVAGALLWGYGVHRWGMGNSIPRFFALNLIVAVACTVVAVPIIYFVFDGFTTAGHSAVGQRLVNLGAPIVLGLLIANVITSVVDKMFSGFASLAAIELLPAGLRARLPRLWMGRDSGE